MPIYEYTCEKCGERQEIMVAKPSQQEEKVTCRRCGCSAFLSPSVPNHRFVGPGFYATDYGTQSGAKFGKS